MKLLTEKIKNELPKLYSTESVPMDKKMVHAKFFNPCGEGSWYVLEYDKKNDVAFGYVDVLEGEFGYFSIKELESIKLPFGLTIERDINFKPTLLKDIIGDIL